MGNQSFMSSTNIK